ncbi:MAG: EamA family transporter [Geminicoccaceae bacterium]
MVVLDASRGTREGVDGSGGREAMDATVFAAVLMAAFLHAGWNAVVNVGLDRLATVLLLSMVQSGLALGLLAFFPLPAAVSWRWLAASALLHTGYKLLLARAYAHGKLSQVYPLARGTAPLLVALAGAAVLGETLGRLQALAVLAIALGVVLMARNGGTDLGSTPPKALAYALGTAVCTASYSLVDGVGARLAGTASGFTLWMFVGDGLAMASWAAVTGGPAAFARLAPAWRGGLTAGAMSLGSYWIAIWAFTRAPIALVAALRETSVLFAMLIAALVLRERGDGWRWAAAGLIGTGVVLMRL